MNILWVIIYSNGFINGSNALKVRALVIMSRSNTHFCTNVTDLNTKKKRLWDLVSAWLECFVCLYIRNDHFIMQCYFYLLVLNWHVNDSCLCYSPTAALSLHLAVIRCLWRSSCRGKKPEMLSHTLRDSTAHCHGIRLCLI